jgi:hypothetical protein
MTGPKNGGRSIRTRVIQKNWDITSQPKSLFSNRINIKRGSNIYFLGFPLGISIKEKSIPVYRHGFVSLDKPYLDGSYLLEALVLPGSSGSPVFDCSGVLLGVLSGHVSYYSSDQPNSFEIKGPSVLISGRMINNSGLGTMIPADKLLSFLSEISPEWGN